MDSTYQHDHSEIPPTPGYDGGLPRGLHIANSTPPINGFQGLSQPENIAPLWTYPSAYDAHVHGSSYDFTGPYTGERYFNGPHFVPSCEMNPPIPLDVTPTKYFTSMAPPAQTNAHSSAGFRSFQTFGPQLRGGPQTSRYDGMTVYSQSRYEYARERSAFPGGPICSLSMRTAHSDDETVKQRRQDIQWLKSFFKTRDETSRTPQTQRQQTELGSVSSFRTALYGATRLVSQLEESCHVLKLNLYNDSLWTNPYLKALRVKKELQHIAELTNNTACYHQLKAYMSRVGRRRARKRKARKELHVREKHAENRRSEKEAAIDKWRLKEIQEVQERKKEQEMKLAADSVLCEVRKKQVDVKRIQDILKSLEKLRRLRKEATARKGIIIDQSDKVFGDRLEQIRATMRRRTAIYLAEKKALMVMLEGEQEEERKREQEKRVMKERERQLQWKQRLTSVLFGEPKAEGVLQPLWDYYSQAEQSIHTLIRIRNDWDKFVVAPDHPDGSFVPQRWILPEPPSNYSWASVLQMADADNL
ncbi:programmed cell death protein 7 isoform X2 [Parambassis ranga]|uniref:Programmed cell death protein 7 isoform X2 n=1 Tax=Parambassis ranga TaxID=210632 RepID=A0A6P7I1U5_9TELE|nr:programmed cell death protein 7 isoform X2 [Parambassis ranga]